MYSVFSDKELRGLYLPPSYLKSTQIWKSYKPYQLCGVLHIIALSLSIFLED